MKSPILFQKQPVIELANITDRVIISPEHGARILQWVRQGREIITWPDNADWNRISKVRGGNPVLFPFIGRHFVYGKNEFWRDVDGTVRPMPMHGFARDAQFSVIEDKSDHRLRMRLIDSEKTRAIYPFEFKFDVVVSLLTQSRLEIRFETTNRGDTPMPYCVGHHFYFPIPHRERAAWTLHLPCVWWGRQAQDGSIIEGEVKSDLVRLDDAALVDRMHIKPLGAKVTLLHQDDQRRLVFELKPPDTVPWYAITTWTQEPDSDFYCVEPWLGLPNAIHHGQGLRRLPPGQMETATCILDAGGW